MLSVILMKIDISEAEKTASILLSSTTAFILNQFASMHQELEQYSDLLLKKEKENQELKEKIKLLEDANKTTPELLDK